MVDYFKLDEVLESFRIIIDTREQNTPKASSRYKSFGVPTEKATLDFGDYCANITLPSGRPMLDTSSRIQPACVIERKMSLDELAACFTRSRDRFQKEFERAAAAGSRVFLLVEGGSWEAIQNHRYRSKYNPKAMQASLVAWSVRYNMVPVFCKPETSGSIIREILYRDIKERLEQGEYGLVNN